MIVVVTGGAGYIGSHAAKALLARGYAVRVVDDLSTGHRAAVDPEAAFYELDILDTTELCKALRGAQAVMHFAAQSIVAQSVSNPIPYWNNNVGGTISLIGAMQATGVHRLIYSSSAATYGHVEELPIREDTPQRPINAYGATKLAVEDLIRDVHISDPAFQSTVLRYFNVVGCAHGLGEDHSPETHIVPLVLKAALGHREHASIFGTDYATPDGTCIRDYVHVTDLVDAHLRALDQLLARGGQHVYNVGTGRGWSVREIIDAAKRVTGIDFPVVVGEPRPGDPPALVTDPTRIRTELGWRPVHEGVDEAIASTWAWMQQHPYGWSDRDKPQVRDVRADPPELRGGGDAGGGAVLVPT